LQENLIGVLELVAELRGQSVSDVAALTWSNTCRLFSGCSTVSE